VRLGLLLQPAWVRVLWSHAAAVLLGVAAGMLYHRAQVATLQRTTETLERRPHFEAASLAYSFGTPDQARVLLHGLLRQAPTSDLDWGDRMMTRVRLAILEGEHLKAGPAPHLTSAADACRRFGRPDCSVEQLRELAGNLAAARQR
jgi:hypothetical protein